MFLLVLFSSCEDSPDYVFKNKAEGRRAFGLQGTYEFSYRFNDTLEFKDTLIFTRVHKNNFLITGFSQKDTFYLGEIVKRKNLYLMNKQHTNGYWDVRAFRLAGDSIYNYSILTNEADYFSEIETNNMFSDYSITAQEDHKTYIINNMRDETYEALVANVRAGEKAGYKKLDEEGLKNLFEQETLSKGALNALCYPNPAKDFLYLDFDTEEDYQLKLIDMSGKIILTDKFSESYRTLNVSSLPNGTYGLEIVSGHEQKNSQMIVIAR